MIHVPVNFLGQGGSVKLGRNRPSKTRATHPHLFKSLALYGALPEPPPSLDFHTGVASLTDILANDSLGDCTSAGIGHIIDACTASAGAPLVITAAQAKDFYARSTGWNGTPQTDQGGNEIDVLTCARNEGYLGQGTQQIAGWVALDPSNPVQIMSAVAAFGPTLYFGLELDAAWLVDPKNGAVWGKGIPDPDDGHCIVGVGYNTQGVQVDTWGLIVTITWDAIAEFCSEENGGNLFAVLTRDILNGAKAATPDALDWETMENDMNQMGGDVVDPPVIDPDAVFANAGPVTVAAA